MTTEDKVKPLFGPKGGANEGSASRGRNLPEAVRQVSVKDLKDDMLVLERYLQEKSLAADARGIWLGYPSLRLAVDRLIGWVGVEWPAFEAPNESAVLRAVAAGVTRFKSGIMRGETDRRLAIANFFKGLTESVLPSLVCYACSGIDGQRVQSRLTLFDEQFEAWVFSGEFDSVLFSRSGTGDHLHQEGMRLKLWANIATINDLGVLNTYARG